MESADRWMRACVTLLVFASTALLVFFGNGLMPRWPLMWVAPLPVLVFALRRQASSSGWSTGMIAFAAWLAGCLNLWGYLRIVGAPLPVAWFADCGLVAVVFAAGVLLTRALVRRGGVWSAWVALPALWVTFEYVRNLLWPHGSGGSLAYSQLKFLPFLQSASLAGPWGMSFVLMLFPVGLALGIYLWRSERAQSVRVLGATLGVVAALLIFGAVRLGMRQPGPEVRVGLVASDAPGNTAVAKPGAATERLFEQYAQQAEGLAARGARVVVLPENVGVVVDPDVGKADEIFQQVADQTGAIIVAGMTHAYGASQHAPQSNEARIYTPGIAVQSYDKEHLLPPFESMYTPGKSRTLLAGPKKDGQTWGVAICKDLDFTEPARDYGRAGAGLMLAPAWDFRVDGFWHGHIAVMRAVEDGFSLARSARRGLLTVTDDRGRVLAETASNAAPFATLLADVPAGHDKTLFLLWGDWFGWCAVVLLVIVVGRLCIRRQGIERQGIERQGMDQRGMSPQPVADPNRELALHTHSFSGRDEKDRNEKRSR
jgi:apolipoprotein N-acyltransferase